MNNPNDTQVCEEIPLAEMIQTLREELELAQVRSVDKHLKFEVNKVELELKVAVGRKKKGQGGVEGSVEFLVVKAGVKAGAELEQSGDTSHTFKLTLTPVSRDGRTLVGGETNREVSNK